MKPAGVGAVLLKLSVVLSKVLEQAAVTQVRKLVLLTRRRLGNSLSIRSQRIRHRGRQSVCLLVVVEGAGVIALT